MWLFAAVLYLLLYIVYWDGQPRHPNKRCTQNEEYLAAAGKGCFA
jgi:hypothetical protein